MSSSGSVVTVALMVLSLMAPRVSRADEPVAPPDAGGSNVEPAPAPVDLVPPPPVEPVVVPPPVEPTPPPVEPPPPAQPPPEPTPPPAPEVRRSKPTLGYTAYRGSFYDIDYGRESAPWASHDGKTAVGLGGLRLFEGRGLMINTLVMILALGNGLSRPLSATRTDSRGNVYVNRVAEEKARAEYIENVTKGAAELPFSLEINGYHDSLGSEMDGMSFDVTMSSSMYELGVKHYGLSGGHLSTNRNYVAATDTPMEFSRWWFGATYDYRRRLYQQGPVVVGARGHAMVALGNPWLALIRLGPEVGITDRFHITAYASQDLHRFDLSKGMGYRAEIGMRF